MIREWKNELKCILLACIPYLIRDTDAKSDKGFRRYFGKTAKILEFVKQENQNYQRIAKTLRSKPPFSKILKE